ncbi:putative glyoxal oxidase precursor [Xylogone sp. PMI_703]|nr:putative glyoxal oxidase precursor [Xylogone sp. PMI_703]
MPAMMTLSLLVLLCLSLLVNNVHSLGATDTITWGGDNSRTGHQINHNMDPAIVRSSQFGPLFKTTLPGNYNGVPEQIFSQPLVYTTPADGVQYIFLATTQNNIYKLDAKTGEIILKRNLAIPFLTADLDGCVDINPHVGVTATGVIDPDTDTWYFTSKTYADQTGGNGPQGKPNGRYYFHAINVNDLSERENFPVDLEGTVARNNPIRSFNGGIHHQRPGLLHSGQYIYAGFASHCVQYNFTGWIMGWDKTTGTLVERFATEGEGVPNTTPGGGIWMSGATGNGYASQLSDIPVNEHNPAAATALEEAAVHLVINDDGSLSVVDFFMPQEKQQLDSYDHDLGTSPLEPLPSEFACGDITRIGVITGKSGKTYWLNLDNLGGYRNGPNKGDDHPGVYPLEGGYIYINVIQHPTHVFKFSCDNGVPSFTHIADSPTNNAYILGVGHGTITSLNEQPGTGLLWTSDVQGENFRIYNAIPENGLLTMIKSFTIPGVTKFTRPVFGDGRVYIGTTLGLFYGFGSPVNPLLNCTSLYDFGALDLGDVTAPATLSCKALIALTVTNITLDGDPDFVLLGLPTVPYTVTAGSTFDIQAALNPQAVGPLSSDIIISTTNNVAGYSTSTPITVKGTGESVGPLLSVSPSTLSFEGVVTGAQVGDIQYSLISETGPFISSNMTGVDPRVGPFTFISLPTTISGNSDVVITVNFDTSESGNFTAYLNVISDGGNQTLVVNGASGPPPTALLEFQTPDGTRWVKYENGKNFTFGNVTENTTRSLKFRVTNTGPPDANKLSLTVSKPPFGVGGLIAANNNVDLAEGTDLAPGESANATLYCSVPKEQWNNDPYSGVAQWTINVNDPSFDKQFIQFECTAVSEQAPPLLANGCFKENNPGRQLKYQIYSSPNRPNIPIQEVSEDDCNYPCSGDVNQICSRNGVGSDDGGAFISLFADSSRFDGNVTSSLPTGPFINPGVDGYTSLGCYTEASTGRALPQEYGLASQTVKNCVDTCDSHNYIYAGLEYGGECWCGNAFGVGSVPTVASACSMTCNDNQSEFCGAGNILNVYSKNGVVTLPISSTTSTVTSTSTNWTNGTMTRTTSTTSMTMTTSTIPSFSPTGPAIKQTVGSWVFQGCYTEATNTRALSQKTYANDSMTLESCATFCAGSLMFGIEYGRECYCGNALNAGSVLAQNQADCNFPCAGDGSEYCGAGNRLEIYALNAPISTSSPAFSTKTASNSTFTFSQTSHSISATTTTTAVLSSSSAATTTTTTTTSAIPVGPTIVPSTDSFNYLGCYTEGTNDRALAATFFLSDNNTVQLCAQECSEYTYIGLEYGRECWCGNSFGAGANLTADSDCNMACAGDSSAYCGAGNRLSVYIKNRTDVVSRSGSSVLPSLSAASASSSSQASHPSTPAHL